MSFPFYKTPAPQWPSSVTTFIWSPSQRGPEFSLLHSQPRAFFCRSAYSDRSKQVFTTGKHSPWGLGGSCQPSLGVGKVASPEGKERRLNCRTEPEVVKSQGRPKRSFLRKIHPISTFGLVRKQYRLQLLVFPVMSRPSRSV